ncbi:hypothetical protein [Bifidobacterium myosotis]|uniref:Uncharacterized protein n=1 Tax=Bifidobacterium myosotis TaxID=1630166 RepID=A0A5M9ZLT2_9BIFI|nr:hypothetical protein [Bifidobacterium myosotis]KAA8828544.1 hypothetical protein EMO91_05235 [Bifidobacterium myosotis]
MSADARYLSGIGLTPVPFSCIPRSLGLCPPSKIAARLPQDCRKLSVLVVPMTDFDASVTDFDT